MFFDDDQKKAITTIMARRKPDGSRTAAPMKAEIVKDEAGEPDGRHEAAQDMMAAMHEKSPQKYSEALSNWMDIHQSMKASMPKDEE